MTIGPLIAILGITYVVAHLLSELFARTRIPDVLMLAMIGVFVGPIMGWVLPAHFGVVGPLASTATLAVLLFNSGTTLRLGALGHSAWRIVGLTSVSYIATLIIVALTLKGLTNFPWMIALLCGAIVGGTSSAVVIPLLAGSRVSEDTRTILLMESTLTDVLVIVIAYSLTQSAEQGSFDAVYLAEGVLLSFVVSALIGLGGGFLWLKTWNTVRHFPDTILGTIAYAFIFFGVAELMGYSGGIAALAFGVTIANAPLINKHGGYARLNNTERRFYDEAVYVLKIFFFIYLGISIDLKVDWIAIVALICTALIFGMRMLVTRVSFPKSSSVGDATLVSFMVPKGLAAAAVAGMPAQHGLPYAAEIQEFVYLVVLFSIVATSVLMWMSERAPLKGFYDRFFGAFDHSRGTKTTT